MRRFCGYSTTVLLAVCVVLGGLAPAGGQEGEYLPVTGPCGLQFPRDHGSHSGYRTEWWYYTGNLETPSGRSFGFQLTFFRRQISPPGFEKHWPEPPSAWRTQNIFLAHAALSDLERGKFYQEEKVARGAVGLSGVTRDSGETRVFVEDWSAGIRESGHILRAATGDFSLELALVPQKAPVLHGDAGYSRKGGGKERASCYYSFTRLKAEGTLKLGEGTILPVHGEAWMDHEFASSPLEPGIVGWDWFSLQFTNQTELMVYLLRKADGGFLPQSGGTFVTRSGEVVPIAWEDLRVRVVKEWKSPRSGARYPAGWVLHIGSQDLEVVVTPTLEDQEMHTPLSTRVTYWEGSVGVAGTMAGAPVKGKGYVELTGYDRPLDALH